MAYNTLLGLGTVNALLYGADPTGVADSTAALRNAHATGNVVYYPSGTYRISGAISVPGGGIVGDGAYQSTINTYDTSSTDVYTFTGALAGVFRDVQIQSAVSKSGGYGVVVNPASGEVSGMRFSNMIFNNMPNGINFVRASLWSVTNINVYVFSGNGILVDNQNNADSGDSSIIGCIFTSGGGGSTAVRQVSSGGLKIIGNKFNTGSVGYLLALGNLVGAPSTSDLMIVGNSFEGYANANIQLQRSSGTGTFANVEISGNQFLVTGTTGSAIYSVDTSGFLSNVNICGNVITVNPAGANGILLDYINNLLVDGNTLIGSGGVNFGVGIGTHATNSFVGLNQISGFTNAYSVGGNTLVVGTAAYQNTGTSGANLPFLNGVNTWSGTQKFNSGVLTLNGATSGTTTVNASATASGTLTLPAATDQLVARATTDTLTNKTLTSPTISGGTIDSAAIGGTTPAAGSFTTLKASGLARVLATNTSGQSIASGSFVTVTGWTSTFDANSNFNAATGVFTAPATGYYLVTAQLVYTATSVAVGSVFEVSINANGTNRAVGVFSSDSATNLTIAVSVSALVQLNSGQPAVIQAFQNTAGAATLNTTAPNVYMSITQQP